MAKDRATRPRPKPGVAGAGLARLTVKRKHSSSDDGGDDTSSGGSFFAEDPLYDPVSGELQNLKRISQGEQDKLLAIERQIYNLETSYLEKSRARGNVVRGYADLLREDLETDPAPITVHSADRLFSSSSTTGNATALANSQRG